MDEPSQLLEMTAEIVSAYVANNAVPASEVPELIHSVYGALAIDDAEPAAEASKAPAVPVKRSVQNEHLICLEDGRKFKSLKRHLQTSHGMTPADYREKWGLPATYPMVAPAYAETRSKLAKDIGLGKKPRKRPRR